VKLIKLLIAVSMVASTSFVQATPITLPNSSLFDNSDVNYGSLQSDCGGGFTCFLDASSLGAGGGGDHFDDAMGVALNGNAYGVGGGDWDGTSLKLDTISFGGLDIFVEFMALGPVMRQLVTVTNTNANTELANLSWQNNTGNDGGQQTIATSNGDLLATTDDKWVVTADSTTGTDNEVNSWIYGSNGAFSPTSVFLTDLSSSFGSSGDEGFSALFDMELLAGQTASLMFFVGIEGINQDGINLASNVSDTSSAMYRSLTSDLSVAKLSQVRNWNAATSVPEPTTLAIFALALLGLRVRKICA
jgi:hypothetical protein